MATNRELFMGGLARFLKEQQEVDVRLKARDSDESIFAHKLILSARSEVFKKMMESDDFKASTNKLETVTLSELKHTVLEALLEFIYSDGSILSEKGKQHVMSLYVAADKYEIPLLRDLCRIHLIRSLNSFNAFNILDLAQIPFDKALNDAAFGKIKDDIITVSSSPEFKDFVVNYPNLIVEILKSYPTTTEITTATITPKVCPTCGNGCRYCLYR